MSATNSLVKRMKESVLDERRQLKKLKKKNKNRWKTRVRSERDLRAHFRKLFKPYRKVLRRYRRQLRLSGMCVKLRIRVFTNLAELEEPLELHCDVNFKALFRGESAGSFIADFRMRTDEQTPRVCVSPKYDQPINSVVGFDMRINEVLRN